VGRVQPERTGSYRSTDTLWQATPVPDKLSNICNTVSDFHSFASCVLDSHIAAFRQVLDYYVLVLRSHNGDNDRDRDHETFRLAQDFYSYPTTAFPF